MYCGQSGYFLNKPRIFKYTYAPFYAFEVVLVSFIGLTTPKMVTGKI